MNHAFFGRNQIEYFSARIVWRDSRRINEHDMVIDTKQSISITTFPDGNKNEV